jgi:predicted ATP-grasp superfamily ATP-dependent carboligase
MRVLVLGGTERHALSIVRSLGSRGVSVAVGESRRYCTASLSRYCSERVAYHSPESNRYLFIESLEELLRRRRYRVVYPVTDFIPVLLSREKVRLDKLAEIAVMPYDAFMLTHDKSRTLQVARSVGVPIPRTELPQDESGVRALTRQIAYPAVVKPRSKTNWIGPRAVVSKVTYARDAEDLVRTWTELHRVTRRPIVQEYIPGGRGWGVSVLARHGSPRAVFTHRRVREYPLSGGASTMRESARHPAMEEMAIELLRAMSWHGVAMVEFRLDERDDTPRLMEVNGRFWGSLPLAVASGVDFPFLLHTMLTEGDVKPVMKYEIGVKGRWMIPGELLHLGASMLTGAEQGRGVYLRKFFRPGRCAYDVVSTRDPLPTTGAVLNTLEMGLDVLTGRRTLGGELKQ